MGWWGPLSTGSTRPTREPARQSPHQVAFNHLITFLKDLRTLESKRWFFETSQDRQQSHIRARGPVLTPFLLYEDIESVYQRLNFYLYIYFLLEEGVCPSNWTLGLLVFLDWTITRRCAAPVKLTRRAPSPGIKRRFLAVRSAVFLGQTLPGNAVLWNRSRLTCLKGRPRHHLPPPPYPSQPPHHLAARHGFSLLKPILNVTK